MGAPRAAAVHIRIHFIVIVIIIFLFYRFKGIIWRERVSTESMMDLPEPVRNAPLSLSLFLSLSPSLSLSLSFTALIHN